MRSVSSVLGASVLGLSMVATCCGVPEDPTVESGSNDTHLGQILDNCEPTRTIDGPDPIELYSEPGAWLKIVALHGTTSVGQHGGAEAELELDVVGGDTEFLAEASKLDGGVTTLSITIEEADLLRQSVDLADEVYVKVSYFVPQVVPSFMVAYRGDEFAVLQQYCGWRGLTEPLMTLLGEDAAQRLKALMVEDDSVVKAELMPQASRPPVPQEAIINPQWTPPEVLAKLTKATFQLVAMPVSWQGDYTICTRGAAGWADCVDLRTPELATTPISAYVDPSDPFLEVWLADVTANLSDPIALLHTLQFPLERLNPASSTLVTLTLPAGGSVKDAVAKPLEASAGVSAELVDG